MDSTNERTGLIKRLPNGNKRAVKLSLVFFYSLLFLSSLWFLNYFNSIQNDDKDKEGNSSNLPNFNHLHYSNLCPGLKSIGIEEFGARRMSLGNLLASSEEENNKWGIYISEPSPNSLYYTNLSLSNWYLSERPFLFAISPSITNRVGSQLSILVPSFEISRAKLLPFAFTPEQFKEINWLNWEESENPYEILVTHLDTLRKKEEVNSSRSSSSKKWTIQIEENVRQFIVSGLSDAVDSLKVDVTVGLASLKVREQRMRKSEAELQILRCAARVTLDSLRAVRLHLKIGMSEKDGEKLIHHALTSTGLSEPLDIIVLFGSNAALPHATASSTKLLEEGEFALFDVGGNLLGYQSDLTRTMLPDSFDSEERKWPNDRAKKAWETVKEAQVAALKSLEKDEVRAMEVDRAAREVIEREGWGKYFSHRLGHGIGLQVHEHPYLNSGNPQILQLGECCSNEPGIYIEASVDEEGNGIGVRLEDMWRRTERGYELLTGSELANSPWEP